eukprot:m51a1_g4496 hypothetical protein (632) ;mRNA; f:338330-342306
MHRQYIFGAVVLLCSALLLSLQQQASRTDLTVLVVVCIGGYIATAFLIPVVGPKCLAKGLSGRDLHKHSDALIPETLGIVSGTISVICSVLLQLHHAKGQQDDPFDYYESGLLSMTLMLMLGFADDMWLKCIAALATATTATAGNGEWLLQHLLQGLLPAVVLGIKDANTKSRASSYQLVADLCRVCGAADGASVEGLATLVVAGLGARSQHMVAASVLALTRVCYEFTASMGAEFCDKLLGAVVMLLGVGDREVVRAVLSFFKVVLAVFPQAVLDAHLDSIIGGVESWKRKNRNYFRMEVKYLFERLLKKYGYERISAAVTDEMKKVLRNVVKSQEHRKKKEREAALRGAQGQQQGQGRKGQRSFEEELADNGMSDDEGRGDADAEPTDLLDPSAELVTRRGSKRGRGGDGGDETMGLSSQGGAQDVGDGVRLDAEGRVVVDDEGSEGSDSDSGASGDEASERRRMRRKRRAEGEPDAEGAQQRGGGEDSEMEGSEDGGEEDAEEGRRLPRGAEELGKESIATETTRLKRSEPGQSAMYKRMMKRREAQELAKKKGVVPKKWTGEQFKAKKAGGDIKRGNVDPFAYVPLNPAALKHGKVKQQGNFKGIIGAAKRGSAAGSATHAAKRRRM